MKALSGRLIPLLPFLPGACVLGLILYAAWSAFGDCPNRDVLGWDGNLRFLTAYGMHEDLQAGRWFEALWPVYDSPTWPPLRLLVAVGVFLAAPGGPHPVTDVSITFWTFVLVIVSLALLAGKLTRTGSQAVAVWLIATGMLLYQGEVFAYALSGMLEVQAMLFGAWTAFFLYRMYANQGSNHDTRSPAGRVAPGTQWGLFVAAQGLYFTKYPYGLVLMIALALLELGWGLLEDRVRLRRAAGEFTRGVGGKLRMGCYLFCAGLFLLRLRGYPDAVLPALDGKLARDLLLVLAILIFVDVNIVLFRSRAVLRHTLPASTRTVYLAAFLPALAWLISHRYRLDAVLRAGAHVQDTEHSFYVALYTEIFAQPWFVGLLTLTGLMFCICALRSPERGDRDRALVAITLCWCLQFATLEFATLNKQLRYVYHLLPVLMVFITAEAVRLPELVAPGRWTEAWDSSWTNWIVALAPPVVFALAVLAPDPSQFVRNRMMCFAGTDPSVVAPARQLAAVLDPQGRYVLMNLAHKLIRPDGSWPPVRGLSTEFDLLFTMRTHPGGAVRFDSPRVANWRGFDRLLLLADACTAGYDARARDRAERMGVTLTAPTTRRMSKPPVCLREWRIVHYDAVDQ